MRGIPLRGSIMSSIPSPQAPMAATGSALPRSLVLLLAAGAGLGVASLYYLSLIHI